MQKIDAVANNELESLFSFGLSYKDAGTVT